MKKRISTLMLALAAVAATAQAQIAICGMTINEEQAAQGNLVPMLNDLENVTATGTITFDVATQTLVLDNATIETSIHDFIIRFLGDKCTVQVKGSNTLSTTSVNPPYAAVSIGYSTDDVTITGDGELSVFSEWWYGFHLFAGSLTIENTTIIANGGGGGICHNGERGGSLVIKNANVKAKSIHRLVSIELVDCNIVEPDGASILYDAGMKSYFVGKDGDWAFDIVISNGSSGIGSIAADDNTEHRWHSLDGKKLAGEPVKKGVYINKGRKVAK